MTPPDAPADSPEVLARIAEGLPLVDVLARRMRREFGPAAALEDLVSYGREGLLSAARSFDATRGVPFRSWASLRARGAMIDGIRSSGQLPRRLYKQLRALESSDHVQAALNEEASAAPAASPEALDARITAYLSTMATAMAVGFLAPSRDGGDPRDDHGTPEEQFSRAELLVRVRDAIGKLPDSERKLLERHYYGDVTMDEAARELGLSKSWGSRLHARAIETVARELKRSRIE